MSEELFDYRKNYEKGVLLESNLPEKPIHLFKNWFLEIDEIAKNSTLEANAMNVSTIGEDGFPKSRIVLLKEYSENGFTFYTNYNSEKAKALENCNKICLSFFWPLLERQVIIKGVAHKTSEKESIKYFNSRPRGSQLGAWASNQSAEVASREVLEKCVREIETRFEDQKVSKPEFWGGYTVIPENYEFWQGRPNRLHDRIFYFKKEDKWKFKRLAP